MYIRILLPLAKAGDIFVHVTIKLHYTLALQARYSIYLQIFTIFHDISEFSCVPIEISMHWRKTMTTTKHNYNKNQTQLITIKQLIINYHHGTPITVFFFFSSVELHHHHSTCGLAQVGTTVPLPSHAFSCVSTSSE